MSAPPPLDFARSSLVMRPAIAAAAPTMSVFVVLGTLAIDRDVFSSLSEYHHGPMPRRCCSRPRSAVR